MKRRMIAGLLTIVLIFGLFGCHNPSVSPDGTNPPTVPTEPPVPQAADLYRDACAPLKSRDSVTLDIRQTTTTAVKNDRLVVDSTQVLSYIGLTTDTPIVKLVEKYADKLGKDDTSVQDAPESTVYMERYGNETLYVELGTASAFTGKLTKEEAAKRYVPVILLDAALYGSITADSAGGQITLHFTSPTAAESWAVPEDSKFLEASGTALLDKDGQLTEMSYSVTYQYGTAQITRQITASLRAEAEVFTLPTQTVRYVPLEFAGVARLAYTCNAVMGACNTVSITSTTNLFCQAGGFAYSDSAVMELCDRGEELLGKLTYDYQEESAAYGTYTYNEKTVYKNGSWVYIDNDGRTSVKSGTDLEARELFLEALLILVTDPEYWKEATVTDLGSVYLVEFTYTDAYGNDTQNSISDRLWEESSLLNKLASKYVNKDLSGYLAVDKYTGIPTASGISYEGVHTIQGEDYVISLHTNRAVESPSFGAYEEITDTPPAETEPAQKATPLFYKVTGKDGQQMWLLGTIHIGDERTGFLPQQIYDAFAASDALAMEIDPDKFEAQLETDTDLQQQVSAAYYYTDGSKTKDHMDAAVYETALQYMKASGNYTPNALYLKPSIWESAVGAFFLQLGHQYTPQQGVEFRLIQLAKDQNKPIREVESSLFQLQMTTGWSDELQEMLLASTLSESPEDYNAQTAELYELWCAGDEKALREETNKEDDPTQMTPAELLIYNKMLPLMEEYKKAMYFDRNAHMLNVAIDYLESRDVVFYAVGLAHLLDDTNGLVDGLRQAGYTVEQVQY